MAPGRPKTIAPKMRPSTAPTVAPIPAPTTRLRWSRDHVRSSSIGLASRPLRAARARRGLAALASGCLVLGGGPALLRVTAGAGALAAVLRRIFGVGDPRGPLLGHPLALERLVLLAVLDVGRLPRHAVHLRWLGRIQGR